MSVMFWVIAALTVVSALGSMLLKNLVHCALLLSVTFAGLALMFLQLDAQFAGFAQILVYVGAVAILVVFAILLTRSAETPKEGGVFSRTWLAGLAVAAAVFATVGSAVLYSVGGLPHETAAPEVTVLGIGQSLMSTYVLPLEIVALLLTVATIGAVIVAMHEKPEKKIGGTK
jgi:NADH-quinone oxidoreductase subunit J